MRKLDLVALTKLRIALVSPTGIIGVNYGAGHSGETAPEATGKSCARQAPAADDYFFVDATGTDCTC